MTAETGWTHGYVTDVSYTNSFFRELAPAWLNHVAAVNGCYPRTLDQGFTHIDLGCGLGQSSLVLAGSYPQGRFYAVDFNPAHIDSAQRLAASLGLDNVRYIESGFAELDNVDLPEFDFITLHGIYSWIGPEARQAVQRFIYKKLKPGGIVYNSYNCLPGWAADSPIRRLLYEFGASHSGNSAGRVELAAKDAKELADLKQGYFRSNPGAAVQVENLRKRQTNYLAHEYLNADWNPFYSIDVAEEMAAAKLTFVGSATLNENHLELMLADESAAFCRKQPTDRLRQLVQDYLAGTRFRRDVFVRGHAHLPPPDIKRNVQALNFAMSGAIDEFTEKTKVPRGEISFDGDLVAGLRDITANGTSSLAEILRVIGPRTKKGTDIERTCLLMTAVGRLIPAAREFRPRASAAQPISGRITSEVNRKLAAEGRRAMTRQYLASPVLGSGVVLDPIDAVALTFMDEGIPVAKLAAATGEELRRRGVRVNKDGVALADGKEAEARLNELVNKFSTRVLPNLIRTGVVDAP